MWKRYAWNDTIDVQFLFMREIVELIWVNK